MHSLPRASSELNISTMHQANEGNVNSPTINNHNVTLENNAQSYNKVFHKGGCLGFWQGTWKCLRDYLIYPIVLVCVFIAACTILLPLSIYYTATSNCRHMRHLEEKDINDFLNIDSENSRILSLEQIRIHAKRMREQEKSTAQKGCDICLSLLCPCTGVCILYNNVKNYLYGIEPSHKLKTFYSYPPSGEELKWLENRPPQLPNPQPVNGNTP